MKTPDHFFSSTGNLGLCT